MTRSHVVTPFRRYAIAAAALIALALPLRSANAAPQYDVAPPGTVMKQQVVYLNGEGMNSRYLAVASRTVLAAASGKYSTTQFQPYLTIYAQNASGSGPAYRRIYQSPGPTDRLKMMERSAQPAKGAPFFPRTALTLVGAAEFETHGKQQLVVEVQSAAADCGSASVFVIGMRNNRLTGESVYQNPCALNANIHRAGPDAQAWLTLTGPYYNATAALCCPTKPGATADVKWTRRGWTQQPRYFKRL